MSFNNLESFVGQINAIIKEKYTPNKDGMIDFTPFNISELIDLFR
jgi:hypothetical protein